MIDITSYKDNFIIVKEVENKDGLVWAIPIQVGLKLVVDKSRLDNLKEHPYIKENFTLNIIQLNKNSWSVCFAEKCNHKDISGDSEFCLKCGVKTL
jgi:hypothetical protein